ARARPPGGAALGGHVVPLQVLVVVVGAEHAAERIGAALDDEVEAHAAGARLDVVARGRDLDFLEVVEVEIGRRRARRGHVGNLDAVHRPARVLRARALRREVRLLTGLVAADVDAIDEHALYAP